MSSSNTSFRAYYNEQGILKFYGDVDLPRPAGVWWKRQLRQLGRDVVGIVCSLIPMLGLAALALDVLVLAFVLWHGPQRLLHELLPSAACRTQIFAAIQGGACKVEPADFPIPPVKG